MVGGRPMKRYNIGMLGLQARLTLVNFGASNSIAFLLCLIGAIVWLWPISLLQAQSATLQRALQQTDQSLRASTSMAPLVQQQSSEERLKNFYDVLGEKRYPEQQVKTLFAIARKTGLTLNQAEYKSSF